eukprot:TRINITY_DN3399_c0_g1_i11.p1 TRINITY_DN3399_c0_g1~~TRINITY_DN3399_c0_g1_i11.p1  ORF type:complete len:149 (-),score=34.82 TRINITY_DN3399_c0_g1_i11:306-752(-)
MYINADHMKLEDCVKSVDRTVAKYGTIDVLFNNAGIVTVGKTTEEISEEEWAATMNLNVTAVWRMTKLVIPVMQKNNSGSTSSIINNSSDWGLVGAPEAVAYCTSKGAVIQLTRAVALECAKKNIRVNAVCPGDTFVKRQGGWKETDT